MSGDGLVALARFGANMRAADLPRELVDKAKSCLLYGLAVGVASMRAAPARQAAQAFDACGRGATRFHDGASCDPAIAAFANATLFHARVQDDAHPAGHVGVVVIPAALTIAESVRAGGSQLLTALIAGYETALRIGRDHTTDSSARGFRTTPLYGVFGAAAAAGRLLGFDAGRMTHALSLAANMASGLREFAEVGSEDFAFQAGVAAQNGLTAARLAAAGATSAPSALDGKAGFFRAYGELHGRYADRLAERLGDEFEMMHVTYKPYPICQFHRSVVRGAIALRERAGAGPLAALEIRMHPFEADFFGVRYAGPFATFPQTFMSAPFCAALGFARRDVTLAGLCDFAAADVLSVVSRIAVIADPQRARYSPRLVATLDDGSLLEWEERDRAQSYLLTWDNARRMAHTLGAEVAVDPTLVQRLVAAVDTIASAETIDPLLGAMRNACRAAAT